MAVDRGTRFGPALAVALLIGCATPSSPPPPEPPRPDPLAEHRRHLEEAWSFLAQRYDTDGDGAIARGEYARGAEPFARLDRDGDGALRFADLLQPGPLPPDFGIPLLVVRLTGDGREGVTPIAPLVDALAALDRDGDGRVARAEFEPVAARGVPLGVDAFATLLAGMDADHDRLLSRPEIARWLHGRDAEGDGLLELRERPRGAAPLRLGWSEPHEREPAPDFAALRLDDLAPVRLSELRRDKPIALLFGSFT